MTSNALFPPNRFSLSDAVIWGVVQRVAPLHVDDNSFVGHKRLLPPLRPAASIEYTVDVTEFSPKTKGERQLKVSASRRERCRVNQARYRERQRQHTDILNKNLQQLKGEIEELETKRQNIIRCAPTDQSVWVVATEYFRHFRYGYMAPLLAPDSPTPTLTKPQRQHAQLDFLKADMSADVTDGLLCGAEAILENWKKYSMHHGDFQVQAKKLELVAPNSLLATTRVSLTITKNTLRHLYPHLVKEEGFPLLAARLLNQRIVMNGSVRFDWDEISGRVAHLESKVDMLTPILQLVGTLENVASVFDKALISPDGRLLL